MTSAANDNPTLAQRLYKPVDIASIVFFRIAYGLIMAWEMWRYGMPRENAPSRAVAYYGNEQFLFKYYGFEWVQAPPGEWITLVLAVVGVFALFLAAGFLYRFSAAVMCVGLTYIFLLDRTFYLNHFYLVCLLAGLMIFIPAHRAFSVDAMLRPRLRSSTAPRWALWLLRFQFGIVYFYGGLAKLNLDWLAGEPMRGMLAGKHDVPYLGPYAYEEWMVVLLTWGGLLLDLLIVPALLWRPTRIPAYLAAVAFHLSNAFLFTIGIFPWMMIAATTIYFEPDWPRRPLHWLQMLRGKTPTTAPLAPAPGIGRRQRALLTIVGIYVVIQALVPFRHYFYPGDASWSEEGHQFAWRMMLRSKVPETRFMLFVFRDPKTGDEWIVDPVDRIPEWETEGYYRDPGAREVFAKRLGDQLGKTLGRQRMQVDIIHEPCKVTVVDKQTGLVERIPLAKHMFRHRMKKMAGRPDMMIQFAQYIAELKRAEGKDVAVHIESWVAMNGREEQLIINPEIDLALQTRHGIGYGKWIVPLTKPLRRNNYREWHQRPTLVMDKPGNDTSDQDRTGQVD